MRRVAVGLAQRGAVSSFLVGRDNELKNILSLLRNVLRGSPLRQAQVDRAIGVRPGYLSQVLIGRLDLKLKVLFAVLEVLELPPEDFFGAAFPPRERDEGRSGEKRSAPDPSPEVLREYVRAALAEELGRSLPEDPSDDTEGG